MREIEDYNKFTHIYNMFVGSLDDDILMVKVRTERDKGLKKWSLAFGVTKNKMFAGEE